MGKVVAFASGKGGVGKTTLTANIGVALAQMNKKVLLIDLDIGLRNLDLILGLHNVIVYDLIDVYEEKIDLFEASYRFSEYGELYFLPASQTIDKEDLDKELFVKFINNIKNKFDYIILDCPAGIETGLKNPLKIADIMVVTVNPDYASLRDADKAVLVAEECGVKTYYTLINRFNPKLIRKGLAPNIDTILEKLGVPLLGIIDDDIEFIKSLNGGKLVLNSSNKKLAKKIKNCAKRLTGEQIPIKIKWKAYKNADNGSSET